MKFTLGELALDKITMPVVFRFEGRESEYLNGKEAGDATFDKRVLTDTVENVDGKIIFNLIENTYFQDTSWSDRPVNVFDGDLTLP